MTKLELENAIEKGLLDASPKVNEVIAVIETYKASGGLQSVAIEVLDALRAKAPDETKEDLILDLMDIVSGFCRKEVKIWNTSYP
jgi:hypothetical protein